MCGIAGIFEYAARRRVDADQLANMCATMVHRGPDGHGVWVSADRRVGLGHRRLSIIDLSSAANQPMSNHNGSIQVVFNGEIYNHAEVRAELDALGTRVWKTDHSDTEVILHAFEEWGIDCIDRFRGMFAFGLWDGRRNELWLVRDRIGIKPLYYTTDRNRVAFASEIKALLADPDQQRVVDERAFYHYLSFLTTPAPQTLFAGIHKLPPGTWLRISEHGDVTQHRYWDVWDHAQGVTASSDEIAERVLAELRTAVKLRKVSDVPVGVFLSGGLDSSTNTALFSEGENRPVQTFSIGYVGDHATYQDELPYARQMARLVNAEHHELRLSQRDLLQFLPRMIELQDEPIGDPVCMPVYFVSKLARDHGVTVCQVGEGADELFWGYERWKTFLRLQRADQLPVPSVLKKLLAGALDVAGHGHGFPAELLRRSVASEPVFWGSVDIFTQTHKQRLLSPRLRTQLANVSSFEPLDPILQRFQTAAWEPSHLNWLSYADLQIRLPELLLMRVDKMSMGASVEARVPFLDHKLVELAMSIPQALKTKNGTLKFILKQAVRGLVPDSLIDRKKQGFGVPITEWFVGELGGYARKELELFCRRTDFLHWPAVSELLDRGDDQRLWPLLNFALWHRRFIDNDTSIAAAVN
jgi:asparagine synthase (glutamine-hydrolysing)